MAFDGVVISNLVKELNDTVIDGRIYKIYQPEPDEILLVIKANKINYRLRLCANASLPLIYVTKQSKENPMTAPNFCMLLRKHIGNGRIRAITQPGFERIVAFDIDHLDEMGDMCSKRLIIEVMGKHSNIIFTDSDGKIIDSIKHIGLNVSSVREVLPGRIYEYPPNQEKISPLEFTNEYFEQVILTKPMPIAKAIFTSITGFSSATANAICYKAGIDGGASMLSKEEKDRLLSEIMNIIGCIKEGNYAPRIYYKGHEPVEFSALPLSSYESFDCIEYESISEVLETYYAAKDTYTRMRQRSVDLRKIVTTAIERTAKKYDLQLKQLKDTEDMDKFRVYGELLKTYGYQVQSGDQSVTVINFYDGEELTIPLDPQKSAMENANAYFEKYNKKKRTKLALEELIEETRLSLMHLKSIQASIEICETEADLKEIKQELVDTGYMKAKGRTDKREKKTKSKPLHYISSDGYHMFVGKNNLQNDYLTFDLASAKDLWFHAKNMPGSHVIVRTNGEEEIPDATYEEAARLAAFYSSGKSAPKVEIDYTRRMQLKKPPKANPGYVIYHTNYSMMAVPDIFGIEEVSEG